MKVMGSRTYFLMALLVFALGLFGLGVSFSQNMVSRQRIESLEKKFIYVSGKVRALDTKLVVENKLVKDKAPDFTLQDVGGRKVTLSGYRGKEVLVYAWTSKCPYCKQIQDYVEEFYESMSPKHKVEFFSIVVLSANEKEQDIVSYLKKNKLSFPVLFSNNSFQIAYGPFGTPCLWQIGKDGMLKSKQDGMDEVLEFLRDYTKDVRLSKL